MADPAVATAAYSYHGLRWAAARMAVRISGPPNVGKGELSRMARKNSPNTAPLVRSRALDEDAQHEHNLMKERNSQAGNLRDDHLSAQERPPRLPIGSIQC